MCSLSHNESRAMYNVYSPGHGQSPHCVSFLWHDPSWMPRPGQRRIQLSNGRAEGLRRFTFSLSHLTFPSLLSKSLGAGPFFFLTIPPLSPCHLSLSLSVSVSVCLCFDSDHVIHSSISTALSQGLNRKGRRCGENAQT